MRTRRIAFARFLIVMAVFALTLSARRADAASITLETEFVGVDVGYFFSGFVTPTFDGRAFARIGSVRMDKGSGLGPPLDAPADFEAYCVDILGSIFDPGSSTGTVPVTVSATAAPMSGWADPGGLTTQPAAGAKAAYLYTTYASGITRDDERTALAMAIWEVLYDSDLSVSSAAGAFHVWLDTTGTIVPLAGGYLAGLGTHLGEASWLRLGTATEDIQDFVGPDGSSTAPEPSVLMLLLGGALARVARSRRGTSAVARR